MSNPGVNLSNSNNRVRYGGIVPSRRSSPNDGTIAKESKKTTSTPGLDPLHESRGQRPLETRYASLIPTPENIDGNSQNSELSWSAVIEKLIDSVNNLQLQLQKWQNAATTDETRTKMSDTSTETKWVVTPSLIVQTGIFLCLFAFVVGWFVTNNANKKKKKH